MTAGLIAALSTVVILIVIVGAIFWFLNISGVYQVLQTSRSRQRRTNRS